MKPDLKREIEDNRAMIEGEMKGVRMRGAADILRRRAEEARKLAESLDRTADQIDAEFPSAFRDPL